MVILQQLLAKLSKVQKSFQTILLLDPVIRFLSTEVLGKNITGKLNLHENI